MDKEYIKKVTPLIVIAVLGIIIFFMITPIILPIFTGLILAYLFFPIFLKINKYIKSETISSLLALLLAFIIFLIPLWFVTPILVVQVTEFFKTLQTFHAHDLVSTVFPTASAQLVSQISLMLDSFFSRTSAVILNYLTDYLVNSVSLLVSLLVTAFVFFYTLKDNEKINKIIMDVSYIGKVKEMNLIKQFKDITNSLIYGQLFVGLVQGVLAAIGLLAFGIPNALVLGLTAIILSVIPIIGPWPIWIPANIYLFSMGHTVSGIVYLLYNLIIVSTLDNYLRAIIVSKKTNISQGLVFIGMIGGLYLFGLLGLIIGPLMISYFITFVKIVLEDSRPPTSEKPAEPKKEEKKEEKSSFVKPFYFLRKR